MATPVKSTDTSAGTTLGRISRNRTRGVLAPRLRAASTYSRWDRLSVWARTMRVIGAIDSTANTNMIAQVLLTQPNPTPRTSMSLSRSALARPTMRAAKMIAGNASRASAKIEIDPVGPAAPVAGEHAERACR